MHRRVECDFHPVRELHKEFGLAVRTKLFEAIHHHVLHVGEESEHLQRTRYLDAVSQHLNVEKRELLKDEIL